MGGWDVYCCFCGAAAKDPVWDPSSKDEYDGEVLAREGITEPAQLLWMENCRLIGDNLESRSMNKTFISGPAKYWDFGSFYTDPGDDPNFPTAEQMDRGGDGLVNLTAYQAETNEPIYIPFHDSCYQAVFKPSVVHRTMTQDGEDVEINIDILFSVLSSVCTEEYGRCLEIDYGEIADMQEQYWWNQPGKETFACDPGDIPRLRNLYHDLPKLAARQASEREAVEHDQMEFAFRSDSSMMDDPFSVLPAELDLEIMLLVPPATVNSLRTAAPSTRRIALPNGYWRTRVFNDMPWLYDLRTSLPQGSEVSIDWAATYEILLRASEQGNDHTILGLVNRRRIWKICETLVKDYAERVEEERRKNKEVAFHLFGMSLNTTPTARVAWPSGSTKKTFYQPVVNSPSAIATVPLVINVEFNEKGWLAGITIEQAESNEKSLAISGVQGNSVLIPAGDWLKGLMLTLGKTGDGYCDCAVIGITVLSITSPPVSVGITAGNKKLLHVSNGYWFVGLQGATNESTVSRLVLLEGKSTGNPPANLTSIAPWENMPSESLLKYTWKDSFPSYDMDVSPVEPGYWVNSAPIDLMPLEALIFGNEDEELNSVTGFACDALFMSLEVRYSDRPTKSVGPQHNALRVFPIDGRGGERVVGINVGVGNIAHAIHVLTNFGRHCILGSSPHVESLAPAAGRAFTGIVCDWAYGGTHLASISMLTSPSTTEVESERRPHDWLQWPKDTQGRVWDIEPPPPTWKEIGPIYGENETNARVDMGGNNRVPEKANIASWLDFSKPIEKIEVWQVHPQRQRNNRTQFKSVILHYIDGTRGLIGPEDFNPDHSEKLDSAISRPTAPAVDEGTTKSSEKGNGTCDCNLYWKDCPDWPSNHHFFGHEWTIKGETVASIRIWARVYMDGIQFVSESGSQSPVYGFAEGEPTGVVEFGKNEGSGKGFVKGLKLMLDSNARPVTQQDIIILGMQALGEVDEDEGGSSGL